MLPEACLTQMKLGVWEKGVDLRTVATLLGHKDIKQTMRYAHLAPEHLQAAVELLTIRNKQDRAVQVG